MINDKSIIARIISIQAIAGANPETPVAIRQQRNDPVIADASRRFRIVVVGFKCLAGGIKAIQSIIAADPEPAILILADRGDIIAADQIRFIGIILVSDKRSA